MLGFVTRITGPGLALVEPAIGGFGTVQKWKKCRKLLIPLVLRMQAAIPRWVEMGKSLGEAVNGDGIALRWWCTEH